MSVQPPRAVLPLEMDDYEPFKTDGFGASGEVSKWRHKTTNLRVALKKFKPQKDSFFEREVAALTQLQLTRKSPFIVEMHTYGMLFDGIGDGCRVIRMECCDGDLKGKIDRRREDKGQFSDSEVRALGRGMLAGLKYIHDAGLMHRDVKPNNVLLAATGDGEEVVKLCDFGWTIPSSEVSHKRCGTDAYNAPEVGSLVRPYTSASDVFSLGVILYELITLREKLGERYVAPQLVELGDPAEIEDALQAATQRACWEIRTACLTCLQKDPRQRPAADPALLGVLYAECREVKPLGAGKYGEVQLHNWHWTSLAEPSQVAIKVMQEIEYEQTKMEVRLLSKANHRNETPHIVGVLGHGTEYHSFRQTDIEFLIMPFCGGGTLAEKISGKKGQSFLRDDILQFATAILSGLFVAHKNRVVHRDLKPENILFQREKGGREVLKLSDFGLSATASRSRSTVGIGSQPYMAPELLRNDGAGGTYRGEVDIFAFGVVLYELCTLTNTCDGTTLGLLLQQGGNEQQDRVIARLSRCADDIVGIVRDCLNCNGKARPDAGACSARLGYPLGNAVGTVAAAAAAADDYLTVGAVVVATGLKTTTELNGQAGKVTAVDNTANKVTVQFKNEHGMKVLGRKNVNLAPSPVDEWFECRGCAEYQGTVYYQIRWSGSERPRDAWLRYTSFEKLAAATRTAPPNKHGKVLDLFSKKRVARQRKTELPAWLRDLLKTKTGTQTRALLKHKFTQPDLCETRLESSRALHV